MMMRCECIIDILNGNMMMYLFKRVMCLNGGESFCLTIAISVGWLVLKFFGQVFMGYVVHI